MDKQVLESINKNKELIAKYPWLTPRYRVNDKVVENYDYTYTEISELPSGWLNSFIPIMLMEISNILYSFDFEFCYRILNVKEKDGKLSWIAGLNPSCVMDDYLIGNEAWNNCEKELDKIYKKYHDISEYYCVVCGKKLKTQKEIKANKLNEYTMCYKCRKES